MYILAYFYHSLDFSKHSHQFWIIFVSSIFDEKYPPIFLRYFRYIRKIQVPIYPYLPIFQSLLITKVRYQSYFIYLFVIMLDSFYYLIISLVSINFLINCHTCFTLFSKDSFLEA